MGWTTPATWVDGSIVTASALNTHIKDNLRYLKGLDGVPRIENAIEITEIATPAAPSAGQLRIYPKSNDLLYQYNSAGVETQIAVGSGSAFPGSPATGLRWYRSDHGLEFVYDGTRWLSKQEFWYTLPWYQNVTMPFTAAGPGTILLSAIRPDLGHYYTRAFAYFLVNTTNNGSNYWGLVLKHTTTALWTFNTSADAANANLLKNTTSPTNNVQSASATFLQLEATKNGTPGSLVAQCVIGARLIAT